LKWSTHIQITAAVAEALAIPPDLTTYLVRGSVDPDRNPDFIIDEGRGFRRIAHHNPSIRLITEYSWISRKLLLRGDIVPALFELGRALHYLQDWCVGYDSGRGHDRLERRMAVHQIDRNDVIRGIKTARSSLKSVRKLLKKVEPKRRATRSLRLAAELSGWLATTVLDTAQGARMRKRYTTGKIGLLVVGIPACTLPAIGWMLGSFSHHSLAGIIFQVCGLTVLLITLQIYRHLREEAKWYGYC